MDIKQRFAQRVRTLRKAKGWSQEELAERARSHRTFVSQIERATKSGVVRLKPKLVPSVDFHAQEAICSCRQADHPLLNFFAFSHARSLQLGP
jgi:transcriptional regulator with XRE-family HTH domain